MYPTPDQVREIITTAKPDSAIESVISYAAMVVEQYITHFPVDRQRAIITWVAAHFLASTDVDGVKSAMKLGDASETYARAQLGQLLLGTPYGQQAILLADGALDPMTGRKARIEPLIPRRRN